MNVDHPDPRLSTDFSSRHPAQPVYLQPTYMHCPFRPNCMPSPLPVAPPVNRLEPNVHSLLRKSPLDLDRTMTSTSGCQRLQLQSNTLSNIDIHKRWSFRQKTSTPIAINNIDKSLQQHPAMDKYTRDRFDTYSDNKENCTSQERSIVQRSRTMAKRSSSEVSRIVSILTLVKLKENHWIYKLICYLNMIPIARYLWPFTWWLPGNHVVILDVVWMVRRFDWRFVP